MRLPIHCREVFYEVYFMRCWSGQPGRQAAEEFVEFVGGVEVGFELARGEFFAKIVETAGGEIERGGEDLLVGENDVAPRGIGAAGKAEGIAEGGAGERDGATVFTEAGVEERKRQRHGQRR